MAGNASLSAAPFPPPHHRCCDPPLGGEKLPRDGWATSDIINQAVFCYFSFYFFAIFLDLHANILRDSARSYIASLLGAASDLSGSLEESVAMDALEWPRRAASIAFRPSRGPLAASPLPGSYDHFGLRCRSRGPNRCQSRLIVTSLLPLLCKILRNLSKCWREGREK